MGHYDDEGSTPSPLPKSIERIDRASAEKKAVDAGPAPLRIGKSEMGRNKRSGFVGMELHTDPATSDNFANL